MPKQTALFTAVILALAGANALQAWSLLDAFLFTDTLPDTTFFLLCVFDGVAECSGVPCAVRRSRSGIGILGDGVGRL